MKYLELEKKLTSNWVSKENAWNTQKADLVARELAALRADFAQKEAELKRREDEANKKLAERKVQIEELYDKRLRELELAVGQERDSVRAFLERRSRELEEAYREKFAELEKEKSRASGWLQQKDEELVEAHAKRENELRKSWEMKQLEFATQYEEKLRKLSEERTELHKDFERRVREVELRLKSERPHTND